jgi:hypothetical protein
VFSTLGEYVYVIGHTDNNIHQFKTSTYGAGTITYPENVRFEGGLPPELPDLNKVDTIEMYTTNNGAEYFAYQVSDDN